MALAAMGLAAALAACSTDAEPVPTTAPTTTTTTIGTTTSLASTTTTTEAPEPVDRMTEILELATTATVGRLDAFYRLDPNGIQQFVGSPELIAQDLGIINDGGLPFVVAPTVDNVPYEILELFEDDGSCLVLQVEVDLVETLDFPAPIRRVEVFWITDDVALFAGEFNEDAEEDQWRPVCDQGS